MMRIPAAGGTVREIRAVRTVDIHNAYTRVAIAQFDELATRLLPEI
jgi:hypothetical protein